MIRLSKLHWLICSCIFIMEEGLLKRGQYDLIYVECVLSPKKNNAFRDRQTGETDNFF